MSRVVGAVGGGAAVSAPVVWEVLGYHFPAGSMVVGLATCLFVRLYIVIETPGPKRWGLSAIVMGLCLMLTAVWIIEKQVDLFAAIGTGGLFGAAGTAIIAFFKKRSADALDGLGGGAKPVAPDIGDTLRNAFPLPPDDKPGE